MEASSESEGELGAMLAVGFRRLLTICFLDQLPRIHVQREVARLHLQSHAKTSQAIVVFSWL